MRHALAAAFVLCISSAAFAAAPALSDAQLDDLRSKRAGTVERLARVLMSEGRLDEARARLEPEAKRLAEGRPDEPVTLDGLRLVYLLGVAEDLARAPAKRDAAFALARKLAPNDERTHLLLGRAMEDLHREDLARFEFQAVLRTPPEGSPFDALALRSLATAAHTNRRWAEAADLFAKLDAMLRSGDAAFQDELAPLVGGTGPAAVTRLLRSVEYARLVCSAWARLEAGKDADWAEAMTSCESAWRIDPEGIEACILGERLSAACPERARRDELAAAWRRRSDYAMATLQGNIAADPRDPANYNALAWFCAEIGRGLPEGLNAIRRALELRPAEPAFLDTLAEIQFRSGEPAAAAKTLRRVTDLSPWADDYYRRQLDRFEAAAKKAEKP